MLRSSPSETEPKMARKKHTLTPLSTHRMDKTLSDISPEDLKKAREMFVQAKAALQKKEDSLAPPPSGDDDVTDRYSTTSSEDIKRTGEIASQFIEGLDKIQDVLLVLVLKFGRSTTMLLAVLLGLIPVTTLLIWNLTVGYGQQYDTKELIRQLESIQREQRGILRQVNEAVSRATAAEAKAKEAKEAAPKVVMDEAGNAKLVVKGEGSPTDPPTKKPQKLSREIQIELDF